MRIAICLEAQLIEVNSIKVSIPIEGHKLPRDILPLEGAPGSAKAVIRLCLKVGEMEFSASVKAKAYRDVLKKVDDSPHGAFAVLQGKLSPGGVISDAGFTVQAVVPKEPQQG